jgi:hypothetical protein
MATRACVPVITARRAHRPLVEGVSTGSPRHPPFPPPQAAADAAALLPQPQNLTDRRNMFQGIHFNEWSFPDLCGFALQMMTLTMSGMNAAFFDKMQNKNSFDTGIYRHQSCPLLLS